MAETLSPLWTHLSTASRITGTWRSALPLYQNQPSPCLNACPVNGRIAEWIKQVEDGNVHGAWVTLTDNNPFPSVAGRICHHPCETVCNRREMDETVGICSLERFVGDTALDQGWQFPSPELERDESVGIVGGGPAGLSAAYQLRRLGFQVSLYEARDRPGGLMRYGIPSYRLSRDVLNAEIDRIIAMGVTLRTGHEVPDAAALRALRAEHHALYLATGASISKSLPALDYTRSWVIDSAEFLAASNDDQIRLTGAHVLVIGGGSAAMDVARSARRLGRKVTVMTLEAEGQLPAQDIEIREAIEEGVHFTTGAMLTNSRSDDQGVTAQCVRVDFSKDAATRSFSVTPIDGTAFDLHVDTIIPAIGQDADLDRWAGSLDADGPVLATDRTGQTSLPGVFAGGDVASMSRFVTEAIGMGKNAARAIAAMLTGAAATGEAARIIVPFDRINTAYQDKHARIQQGTTGLEARLSGFDEVQLPLDPADARREAARCFSCGTCILCDNCYAYCPDMAITKHEGGYSVDPDYCKGCGLCVTECPTGAIHMHKEERR